LKGHERRHSREAAGVEARAATAHDLALKWPWMSSVCRTWMRSAPRAAAVPAAVGVTDGAELQATDSARANAATRPRLRWRAVITASYHAAVKRVLITGMSATGKSSVLAPSGARYKTIDTDYGGWTERDGDEWLWREDRITSLLATEDAEVLFISGTVRNQVGFYPRFDHVVLLSAPAEVMSERLRKGRTIPTARIPTSWPRSSSFKRTVEPALRRAADLEVGYERSAR